MLVSIILPVYNCADTIERCLRSIFGQEYQDFEVIAVDDCSADSSLETITQFVQQLPAEQASKFHLLRHKENKGSGAARATGMRAAQGEYMIQIDSDDYVAPHYLSRLIDASQGKADMVICQLAYFDTTSTYTRNEHVECDKNYLLTKILTGEIHSSLCNKMMKTSIIRQQQIEPYQGLGIFDDMSVTYRVLWFCNEIRYVPEPLYFVDRTSLNSATFSYREKAIPSLVNLRNQMLDFAQANRWSLSLRRALELFGVEMSCYMVRSIKPKNLSRYRSSYMPGLCAYSTIWKHPHIGAFGKIVATLAKAKLYPMIRIADFLYRIVR